MAAQKLYSMVKVTPAKHIRIYTVDRGSTDWGVSIISRNRPDQVMPTTVSTMPDTRARGMVVCTVRRTSSSWWPPMPWATATPVPTDSPTKKFTRRLVRLEVAPTAATLTLPQNCPTITRSAALNNSCKTFVKIMGMVYRKIPDTRGPDRRSVV